MGRQLEKLKLGTVLQRQRIKSGSDQHCKDRKRNDPNGDGRVVCW